jgi:glutaconate CoA-transferase subunit B
MTGSYTLDELMCVLMAREVRDGDWVNHGAMVPLAGAALMLAKALHAPNVDFFYLGTVFQAVTPEEHDLGRLMLEPASAYHSSRALMSHYDIVSWTLRGNCNLQFLRPIQVDAEGSVNVSVVGSRTHPRYRFHGIAVADAMVLVERPCIYVTEHDRRVFVEKLSFRTGAGHVDGGHWRERIGAPGNGPTAVITPLCVLDFDTPNRRARVRSTHPGVTIEELRERTGFELIVDDALTESVPPTAEELRVLREVVDPGETRKLEFKELRDAVRRRLIRGGAVA